MMVTFVSQCQKKALNRTRRVLDAFANRIGDNTWQTIITEDGLIAVKTLLRKTATKNTAVSCHWIRSRSRSELVWVVGNRDQFNPQGIVPVNTTTKELFMDISTDKPNPNFLYANTHLQPLAEHLFAVGYMAEQLHNRLMPNQNKQTIATFVAGCLHDLGKIDPCFQDWVRNPKKKDFVAEDGQHIDDTKFSFDKHPRHNEVSVLLYQLLDNIALKQINTDNKKSIKHVIYWHHAKPFRKEKDFVNYGDIYKKLNSNLKDLSFAELLAKVTQLLKTLCTLDAKYRTLEESVISKIFNEEIDLDAIETLDGLLLPYYKKYDAQDSLEKYPAQIQHNADNNVMRTCVISADRWVSALSPSDLHKHIKNNSLNTLVDELLSLESTLCSHIEACLTYFPTGERSNKQSEIANQLVKAQGVAVLAGPAGCGKTKIALEWAKLKNAQQLIWICPRVQVCQGLFHELISEQYLPNAKIEINTGEFKYTNKWDKPTPEKEYFSGDIVITTIDQIFGAIITHTKANSLINYLNAHVVFDEFHEYINMPAFNLLFAELIECKQQQAAQANTLLVSATPHYFYCQQVLKIDPKYIITMPSFNPSTYRIEFEVYDETKQDESNPLYQSHQTNTFVISNTAITAQKSFIRNKEENSVLLHSKFKKSDKQKWFKEVYESFKKDGTRKFDVLRSGPIVQASLNISCDAMVTEITNAEDCLQRLGRLDRFGLNKNVNMYCIAVPEPIHQGKGTGSAARFLSRMFTFGATKAWYQLLQAELGEQAFTLPKLYKLYEQFHKSDNGRKFIASDLIASFKKSVELINLKVIDPITIPPKKVQENGRAKISKNSLRGDNRFVQMAVCDMNDPNHPKFTDQYAYSITSNEKEDIDNLTEDLNRVRNLDLINHMAKKHGNIDNSHPVKGIPANKMLLRCKVIEGYARDPELPIYLSYTKSDLDNVGGEKEQHSEAIYYAICDKQPIGAISIKQLTTNEE
ncbi:MAG: CRISPR-associated endonuclease Cas3'' [Methylococcaceae bacterium]|nr:CRISPR-associated endonuclease Cas3'' [Methylococcaceae bacterium]